MILSGVVSVLDPKPDIVFLDIHVPPLDGFAMLAKLKTLDAYQNIPIIALTASVMNEEIEQLATAGFSGCISKPVDGERFPEVLEQILNGERIWHIFS